MQKKTRTFLFWFILIQPFLDIYWFYKPPLDNLFKFSIPTILRIIGIIIVSLGFISSKENRQRLKKQYLALAYIAVLILYCLCHLYSVSHFTGVDPNNYNYSAFSEIFYLFRMTMPIIVLYVTRYIDFPEKKFEIVIKAISGLYSFTIVLSNLFVISLTSYHSFAAKRISANIFAWFTDSHYYFSQLASKGFFFKANTASAILFMLLPLMLYFLSQKINFTNILLVFVQTLAMLMLGTKVASLGALGVFIIFFILYLLHTLGLKNEKFSRKFVLVLLLLSLTTTAIIPYSPTFKRNTFETSVATTRSKEGKQHKLTRELNRGLKKYHGKEKTAFLKHFIKKHYWVYSLKSGLVLKNYSYKNDPYFWLEVMRLPASERMNYRKLDARILKKVMKTDTNKFNKLFGISFIRENNIFPLEHDFVAQYFSLGILGVLVFLGVYIWYLLAIIYYWIKYKAFRSLYNSSLIVSSILIIGAAFIAGNVFDYLSASLIIGFIIGYLRSRADKVKQPKTTA